MAARELTTKKLENKVLRSTSKLHTRANHSMEFSRKRQLGYSLFEYQISR